MKSNSKEMLIVEDNDEDFEFTVMALRKAGLHNDIRRCINGDDALDYLYRRGKHKSATEPNVILLDLNMPGTDGREVLSTIKRDPKLAPIPVIILTTSGDDVDIESSYLHGANSYVQKPVDFDGLMNAIKRLKEYWFEVVILPRADRDELLAGSFKE